MIFDETPTWAELIEDAIMEAVPGSTRALIRKPLGRGRPKSTSHKPARLLAVYLSRHIGKCTPAEISSWLHIIPQRVRDEASKVGKLYDADDDFRALADRATVILAGNYKQETAA